LIGHRKKYIKIEFKWVTDSIWLLTFMLEVGISHLKVFDNSFVVTIPLSQF
jgi:hypothetical protein